jgi:hypothetical protein
MGNDGNETLELVIKEQNRIERLLLNKGVDEVICLFWYDILTFRYDQGWRGCTWESGAEYFMLGVKL